MLTARIASLYPTTKNLELMATQRSKVYNNKKTVIQKPLVQGSSIGNLPGLNKTTNRACPTQRPALYTRSGPYATGATLVERVTACYSGSCFPNLHNCWISYHPQVAYVRHLYNVNVLYYCPLFIPTLFIRSPWNFGNCWMHCRDSLYKKIFLKNLPEKLEICV